MDDYKVREKELLFVLKEQLNYGQLCEFDRYKDFSENEFDMVVKEGINFARGIIDPLREKGEEFGVRYEDGKVLCLPEFKEAFKKCGEDGWIAAARDTTYGGQGFPLMMRIIINELFYGAYQSFNILPSLTHGAGHLIESFGTNELKELYLPRMYAGTWAGTMVLTEPDAGSSLSNIQAEAKREDGYFKITGNKIFATYGEHDVTENIIHLVLARIENAPSGVEGISLFVVPKIRVNNDGTLGEPNDVVCDGIEEKMGLHASPTTVLNFGQKNNCIGSLCGEENKGLAHMFQLMNEARINSGVSGMTLSSTAYLNALDYCKKRLQGADITKRKEGLIPIIDHPDVRRMLLWMKAVVEGLRSMIYLGAFYSDLAYCETDSKKKEHYGLLLDFLTPIIKAYSSHMGFEVCSTAMQCFGGHGYISDYPIEMYLRDVRAAALYEGTNGIQSIDLCRRKMRMKEGAALNAFIGQVNDFIIKNKDNPKLAKEIKQLRETLKQINDVSIRLSSKWESDPLETATHTFPLLLCFGELTLAWRLLDMAVIADEALSKGIKGEDFYRGKILAATYFTRETLPQTQARLSTCLKESREITAIRNTEL